MSTAQIDRRVIKTHCPFCYRTIVRRVTVTADGTANVQCVRMCKRWFLVRVVESGESRVEGRETRAENEYEHGGGEK